MPEDRNELPPGYDVAATYEGAREDGYDALIDGGPYPTEDDVIAACWAHRDRVVVDAVLTGLQAFKRETLDESETGIVTDVSRELKARGIEMAIDDLEKYYDGVQDVEGRLRALAEKVRRGDA